MDLLNVHFNEMHVKTRKSVVAIWSDDRCSLLCRCDRLAERHISVLAHRPTYVRL